FRLLLPSPVPPAIYPLSLPDALPIAPGILGRTLCRLDRVDLVGALGSSAVAKIVRDNKLDAHLAQPVGFGDREVRRDRDPPQTALVEEPLDDRCPELGARDAAAGQV